MRLAVLVALLLAPALHGQMVDESLRALQDNSFLVEEAYNQEKGILQHSALFVRDDDTDEWVLQLKTDVPLGSIMQQVSLVVPIEGNGDTELADVRLDYRYQLTGNRNTVWAVAPRLSLILPTGDEEHGHGNFAAEFVLPISRVWGSRVVTHTNFGAHGDFEEDFLKADLIAGQSVIVAINRSVHVMLEAALEEEEGETDLFISPGVRFGWSTANGIQFVAGIGVPFGVGHASDRELVLGYLSVAHLFGRR
jgi:hypothetical protein